MYTPQTFEEAVNWLLAQMAEEDKAELKALAEDEVRLVAHFSVALFVRNQLLFLMPDYDAFREAIYPGRILMDPDSVSNDIVEGAWRSLHGITPLLPPHR